MGDLACDLECVKKLPRTPKVHEFVGTVKILLVDPTPSEYMWKRIDAALVTLAYFMIGATVMNILFFTLTFRLPLFMNLHIVLCTCGYQLCIPCGMLILNCLSGSSNVLRPSDRKFEHLCLQIFGLALGIGGTALVFLTEKGFDKQMQMINLTIHSVCGMLAGACGISAMFFGPIIFHPIIVDSKSLVIHFLKKIHMFFALICLVASSITMISGIHRYCIYFWLPVKGMAHFLYLFCFLYTAIIIKNVLRSMLLPYEKK